MRTISNAYQGIRVYSVNTGSTYVGSAICRNIYCICLAGSGRGQVQGLGYAQMEQSFQESGGWSELLTAGL